MKLIQHHNSSLTDGSHFRPLPRPNSRRHLSFRRFLGCTALFLGIQLGWGAGVELSEGSVIEFASLEEARRCLGERDAFVKAMSQFDRCVRMKTSRMVTEVEFLKYSTNQVRAWSASEQSKVSNIVVSIRGKMASYSLPFPARIALIKTTGLEEGGAGYCRGGCVILPQSFVNYSASSLQDILIHELFHILSSHDPSLRRALYSVAGYFECGEVTLPESLQALRITNPDAFHNCFAIRVRSENRTTDGLPVIYSSSPAYNGSGELLSYLRWMLLELELRDERYVPVCLPDGQPKPVSDVHLSDYTPQIGADSRMPIHPEEILAEYFVLVVNRAKDVGSPRLVHLLRKALLNPRSQPIWVPAGWYRGEIIVGRGGIWQIEVSSDLVGWRQYDYCRPRNGLLELIDREAWLTDTRFYRARAATFFPRVPGSTNEMVWIEPGSFTMGSPTSETGRDSWEGPLTPISITRGFWLGKHEVTQGEYRLIMEPATEAGDAAGDLPVSGVSWSEAMNYCARLTEQIRTRGELPEGYAYRLPTEAEWEYACRADTSTPFNFGDDPEQVLLYRRAWFGDNSGNQTHSVGLKMPNAWGLHDMHGNVDEWCWDRWSERLPGRPVEDYAGPAQGTKRSYRGGSSQSGPQGCRSAFRYGRDPDEPWAGFRVALAPPLP